MKTTSLVSMGPAASEACRGLPQLQKANQDLLNATSSFHQKPEVVFFVMACGRQLGEDFGFLGTRLFFQ